MTTLHPCLTSATKIYLTITLHRTYRTSDSLVLKSLTKKKYFPTVFLSVLEKTVWFSYKTKKVLKLNVNIYTKDKPGWCRVYLIFYFSDYHGTINQEIYEWGLHFQRKFFRKYYESLKYFFTLHIIQIIALFL